MDKSFFFGFTSRFQVSFYLFALIAPFLFPPGPALPEPVLEEYDHYAKIVSVENNSCIDNPSIVNTIIRLGERLGVTVRKGQPKLLNKDATYEAFHGELGSIIISNRPMTKEVYCMLITHEFIHVLQHLHGNLEKVIPLGWELDYKQIYSYSTLQEAEAYAYQNSPIKIIYLLERYIQEDK